MATLSQCDRCKTIATKINRLSKPDGYVIDLCNRCFKDLSLLFADWLKGA